MNKSETLFLWLRYLVINGIFAAAIYFGMFAELHGGTNIDGAANLALFIGWITGILGTLILLALAMGEYRENTTYLETLARLDPSVVPFPIDLIFDICVTIAFAWSGNIILALFYALSIHAGKAIRDSQKNMVLNKLKNQQS